MPLDDTAGLRRIILRIMLGALAVSAGLAVLGVLIKSDTELSFRMIGTGVAATITSALLLASCKSLDSEKYRRTGLLVMALILAEFMLVLIALWDPLRMTGTFRSEEFLAITAAIFPVAWVPGAMFFHVRQLRGGRLAGLLGMAASGLALVFFVFGTWGEGTRTWGPPMNWMYWETGWACWFFAFASAACTGGVGVDHRHWRWIGLAAAVLSFALGLHDIWHNRQTVSTLFTVSTTLAILIGHANLVWLCKLNPGQRPLRWLTTISAWTAGATFDYAIVENLNEDLIWRIAMAAGICGGCGTVAVAIVAAFNRRTAPPPHRRIGRKETRPDLPGVRQETNRADQRWRRRNRLRRLRLDRLHSHARAALSHLRLHATDAPHRPLPGMRHTHPSPRLVRAIACLTATETGGEERSVPPSGNNPDTPGHGRGRGIAPRGGPRIGAAECARSPRQTREGSDQRRRSPTSGPMTGRKSDGGCTRMAR